MASFIESFLGGAAEGLNEQYDMKRKEERSNRMLEKELTMRRDFSLEDERLKEEKQAKKEIQALGAYYNPANVDRITAGGAMTVTQALARAKELQAIGKRPDDFINPAYIAASSNNKVKYVGDKGWDGWAQQTIKQQKELPKIKRQKASGSQSLFAPIPQPLATDTLTFDNYEDLLGAAQLQHLNAKGTPQEKEAYTKLVGIQKLVAEGRRNAPVGDKKGTVSTLQYADGIKASYLELQGFNAVYENGVLKGFDNITEGNRDKFLTAKLMGLSDVNKQSTYMNYYSTAASSKSQGDAVVTQILNSSKANFNKNVDDKTIIDGGAGKNFQFTKSKKEMEIRINQGLVPEGATISFVAISEITKKPEIISTIYTSYADAITDNGFEIKPYVIPNVGDFNLD